MPRKKKTFSVEHKDLDVFAGKLLSNAQEAPARTAKVVKRGAFNIKKGAAQRAPQGPHLPYYAKSITYDTGEEGPLVWAEIGPDKRRRQGPLGNLLEYGSPTSPPHPHLGPAGDEEEPKFAAQLEKLAAKLAESE